MRFAKIINRRIRKRSEGVDFAGDVNAAIAANVGERGGATHVSSSSTHRIVQRSGRDQRPETDGHDQQQGR
jgi:hypothetical protein